MRAARHARVDDPSRGPLEALRRSAGLALAAFAAVATLLLPGPAVARPANVAGGSVATTGGVATAATSHSTRRTHRGEQAGAARSSVGRHSTNGADASSPVLAAVLVAASHGAGHGPAATLPSTPQAAAATAPVAGEPSATAGSDQARAGTRSSRAPPTA
jgi:hypothetical protein